MLKWTNKSDQLFVQRLNRHQNHLELMSVNPDNGQQRIIYEEKDDYYIDIHDNLTFYKDDSGLQFLKKAGVELEYIEDLQS